MHIFNKNLWCRFVSLHNENAMYTCLRLIIYKVCIHHINVISKVKVLPGNLVYRTTYICIKLAKKLPHPVG